MPSGRFCFSRFAVVAVVSLLSAGCGGERVVKVTGTATRNGDPVPNLVVHFVPEKGERSFALTDPKGRFSMRTSSGREGVLVGSHKVWVQLQPVGPKDPVEMQDRIAALQSDPQIAGMLEKYGSFESTPLKKDITTRQEINLALD
jgi:hypothetical protein